MAAVHCRSSSEVEAGLACRDAGTLEELATHHDIREAVFVLEQRLFAGSDRDAHDDDGLALHVVGYVDGTPAGTVRLYPIPAEVPGEMLWKGDRLAVLAEHRHAGLGGPLVRHAVASAGGLGGTRMVAQIQLTNV
ncbi:MAG: MSMEG_0567/Sll0786 family nitrogen starvation N-acetyltransferase, partial [Marmoricola sp.]